MVEYSDRFDPQGNAELEPMGYSPSSSPGGRRLWPIVREVLVTIILATILFFSIRVAIQNFRVVGTSMEPYIQNGHYLLVNKLVYTHFAPDGPFGWLPLGVTTERGFVFPFHPPHRGDLVVFHSQFCPTSGASDQCIKRIVGLPEETVEIHKGHVLINGSILPEPYIAELGRQSTRAVTLDHHSYYVLGDNRTGSYDSRAFGPVDLGDIIGKAWVTYWPPSSASVLRPSPPLTAR